MSFSIEKNSALDEINKFHFALNQSNLVPSQWYRRNHIHYTLVSYINQIVALFLSQNYENIPVFIKRASEELENKSNDTESKNYIICANNYLNHMVYFIYTFELVEKNLLETIIPNFLNDIKSYRLLN